MRKCSCCQCRDPQTPQVCDACRWRLRRWLREIRDLVVMLEVPQPVADERLAPVLALVVDQDGKPVRDEHGEQMRQPVLDERGEQLWKLADPVAGLLPAGMVPGESHNPRVSGYAENAPPISLDAVDLTATARSASVTDPYGDQVGELSISSVLDEWVTNWREYRNAGEIRPHPAVEILTGWLSDRVNDACDDGRGIREFYLELGRLVAILRAVNGLVDRDEYLAGVPCSRCDKRTLWRTNGSDWVECGSCPHLMSVDEYRRHTEWLASLRHGSARRAS